MSLTKKEKAELERGRSWRALRWSEVEQIAPDLPIPKYPNITTGWTFNTFTRQVRRGWSESMYHGDGEPKKGPGYRGGSQGGIALYSTEELAWRALRCAVEREAAKQLLSIDESIAHCRAQAAPAGPTS